MATSETPTTVPITSRLDGSPVATAMGHPSGPIEATAADGPPPTSGPVGGGRGSPTAGLVPPLPARATKSVPSAPQVMPRGLVRPLAMTGGAPAAGLAAGVASWAATGRAALNMRSVETSTAATTETGFEARRKAVLLWSGRPPRWQPRRRIIRDRCRRRSVGPPAGVGEGQARQMQFLSDALAIKTGDAVRWVNHCKTEPHTATER